MKEKNFKMCCFIKNIPILNDNYIWIIYDFNKSCIIIDPGLSEPVLKIIQLDKLNPIAILLTHDHHDHVSGVFEIINQYPDILVFGPHETKKYGVHNIVCHGDKIFLLNKIFYVFFTPGHTAGHVSYYSQPYIFCGDTLFSGGCGRVYKKMYLEMYHSIKTISSLPKHTMLCCAHEYTISNLVFSMKILPNDAIIRKYYKKIKKQMNFKNCSLPSCLRNEFKYNLFLRTNESVVKKAMGLKINSSDLECFIKLRCKKDVF